jgi:predicted metal-dependent phosphoesterase TrpH
VNFKADLHTHSVASSDGGISLRQYRRILEAGILDCIAITDHNSIDFATQAKAELGERIIVGEEIMTNMGEIVGLFLDMPIRPGLSPEETIAEIKAQDVLVYIPHPFETIRKGLHPTVLETVQDTIDIIEACNGRAFLQNRSQQAVVWAKLNQVPVAASSDAHGIYGLGRTFTTVSHMPSRDNLVALLANGALHTRRPKVRGLLYPKYHRVRKKLTRQK